MINKSTKKLDDFTSLDILKKCNLCPRKCFVNRLDGELGYCNASGYIKVAKVSLHYWEEPCISGELGSGTVFFSNCNLKCVFCQNYKISHDGYGKTISINRLSEIFLEQQKRGALNINLVTPTHYVPQIIESLKLAKQSGLSIPILYNSNGYENIDTIKSLKGFIDVYLPDLKYYADKYALKYSKAPNYFNTASKVITEMVSQVGKLKFDDNGIIQKGVIIRHLMLPGLLFDSKKVIDFIHTTFNDDVYISLMNQYTPMHVETKFPEINKTLNQDHYDALINYCLNLGITKCFIQDSGTSSPDFIPNFNLSGI
ncbi:radical SAM protein [Clostridium estertheticum]|uniref:radical SAM protein n=1 Tax=Clostridium estertheticum TaxID=238834 RepID=UPI001CF0E373|nr:radical SAM protein [Clostridium estertheticum]MCB2307822.1 radical SAM protein [Clostridium estertheticum]MCB2345430.1 radical SAM protein [Clostridium estertheticum]MCB2350722.1 radical SAM protein [Clostridium estertheticum]WAG47090.1 radical SAM protein [Clostridium estertheticum]